MTAVANYGVVSSESEETARRRYFSEAEEKFAALLEWAETCEGTLSQVEEEVEKRGRGVLRAVIQGHLDLRARQEERHEGVEGSDGVVRSQRRPGQQRTIATLFGEVKVTRIRYESRQPVPGLCPLDGQLNLPRQKYSEAVQRQVVLGATTSSFDVALEGLEERSGIAVPKRQAEEIVQRASVDFEAFYEQRPVDQIGESLTESTLTVLTTDGKGILVYPEDLRPDTHKKVQKESGGKLRFRKRMAQVASVYHVEPFERGADSIISGLMGSRAKGPKPQRPKPRDKRVWASIVEDPEVVIDQMLAEALRRDPQQRTTWVVVVDGAQHQIDILQDLARARGVRLTIICDIIHVLGYLWDAAKALTAEPTRQRQWVETRLRRLLNGQVSRVAAGIRRAKTMLGRKLTKAQRASLDACANYLLNHKHYLRYDRYIQAGYPISSGVIEGTVRHLVSDRMAIAGAHWRLRSAEAILRLRALRSSGHFDEYWRFHQQRELHRNHLAKYPEGKLPTSPSPHLPRRRRPHLRLIQ